MSQQKDRSLWGWLRRIGQPPTTKLEALRLITKHDEKQMPFARMDTKDISDRRLTASVSRVKSRLSA